MNKKQSLFHIAKRDTLPWYKAVLIRGGAIVLALIVCAIVTTLLTGENPIKVYCYDPLRRVRYRRARAGSRSITSRSCSASRSR